MLDSGHLAAFLGARARPAQPPQRAAAGSFFAYAFSGGTELLARTGVFYVGLALVLVPWAPSRAH